jgi:hypothetical protein
MVCHCSSAWEKKSDDGGVHDKDNVFPASDAAADTIWDWLDDVNPARDSRGTTTGASRT